VIGSRTPPVEEVMRDGENGLLADFFDVEELANRIADCLAKNGDNATSRIRSAARQTAIDRFDTQTITLPAYLELLRSLQLG
jgi:glycosyltransferase involved in cell wall biosynthesis